MALCRSPTRTGCQIYVCPTVRQDPISFGSRTIKPYTDTSFIRYVLWYKAALCLHTTLAELTSRLSVSSLPAAEVAAMSRNINQQAWEHARSYAFTRANYFKFTSSLPDGQYILVLLLGTGNARLVATEGDMEGGLPYRVCDPTGQETTWPGNLAGEALERVRARIRAELTGNAQPDCFGVVGATLESGLNAISGEV